MFTTWSLHIPPAITGPVKPERSRRQRYCPPRPSLGSRPFEGPSADRGPAMSFTAVHGHNGQRAIPNGKM
jgi:hypothetical protein